MKHFQGDLLMADGRKLAKQFARASGALITVGNATSHCQEFIVTGSPTEITKARNLVSEFAKKVFFFYLVLLHFYLKLSVANRFYGQLEVSCLYIPKDQAGRVIGKDGSMIKHIKTLSGACDIQVHNLLHFWCIHYEGKGFILFYFTEGECSTVL